MSNLDVEALIFEEHGEFTISLVTSKFAFENGYKFFKSYQNSPNYIASQSDQKKFLRSVLSYISKRTPQIADLVKFCFKYQNNQANLADVIDPLFKLFSAHEHQAAGPNVIDPIIIREDAVTNHDIAEIVNLHKNSIIRPRIVIILKDNNINRAKDILCFCHHGLRVRIIDNHGLVEISKVINVGAEDVEQFLDIYARQCFDACSKTRANVILNEEWASNSSVRIYGPQFLRFRSNIIYQNKLEILNDLNATIEELDKQDLSYDLNLGLKCLAHLFRVYCNDSGGKDIETALKIANESQNEILVAHTYRYAHFIPNKGKNDQIALLRKAQDIFDRKSMMDHSIYCENNRLLSYFYNEEISLSSFDEMLARAQSNVPGLVGMSTILNNVGVAHLYHSQLTDAIECFEKGLRHHPDPTKELGLRANLLTAKARAGQKEDEIAIRNLVEHAVIHFGPGPFAFLGANNLINILKTCPLEFARDLVSSYPIHQTIVDALSDSLGSSSLTAQVQANARFLDILGLKLDGVLPSRTGQGIRQKFVEVTGYNPAIYNVWF